MILDVRLVPVLLSSALYLSRCRYCRLHCMLYEDHKTKKTDTSIMSLSYSFKITIQPCQCYKHKYCAPLTDLGNLFARTHSA